jgi:branched-chain amino acid transport system substrate-binding protein
MSHRILLSIRSGSFETGFEAEVQIGKADRPYHVTQSITLPPAPKLPISHQQWQAIWLGDRGLIIPPQITNEGATQSLLDSFDRLTQEFSDWLRTEPVFRLREAIVRHVPTGSAPRFLLDIADNLDPILKKLPWYTWDFLRDNREYYPDLDIVLSSGNHESIRSRPRGPIKILAIFSRAQGLNVAEEERLLKELPNTQITVLNQPTRTAFIQALSKSPWDIIYFAGHSRSTPNCEDGRIYLNETEAPDQAGLSPLEVRDSFKTAIDQGLQLVLLNSCDGLGLAEGLADLKLPRSIVMREPVPDPVAPIFLRYFLGSLQGGKSIHGAVCKARQLLQDGHTEYPCAAALPILCQNPTAPEPNWIWRDRSPGKGLAIAGALLGASLLVGLGYKLHLDHQRIIAQEQQKRADQEWLDRHISSGEKILFETKAPQVIPEHKRLGTLAMAQRNYPEAVKQFTQDWKQIDCRPDPKTEKNCRPDPETLIYLNNAKIGDRPHLKIAASLPIGKNPPIAAEILRGIAQRQQEINETGGINGKPLWVELANDNNSPEDVKPIAHHYVADSQTLAVIGSNASNASVPAADIYKPGKLLMLSPTSFADKLGIDNDPYSARMVPGVSSLAKPLVNRYLKAHPNAKIVLCFDSKATDNDSFSKAVENSISEFNKENGTQAKFLTETDGFDCQLDKSGFNAAEKATEIVTKGVDTVFFSPYIDRITLATTMASNLAQAAKAEGKSRPNLLGSPTLFTGKTLEADPAALEGLQLPAPWHIDAVPDSTFPKTAQDLWKARVGWRSAMAYDAVYVVAEGLRIEPVREGVLRAFKLELTGATGPILFNKQGWGDRKITDGIGDIMEIKAIPGSPHGFDFVLVP